jgi:hypothetical protein
MKKVKCFQCGEVVSLIEAVDKGWNINKNTHWKDPGCFGDEGCYGTCPDELRIQHIADEQDKFQKHLEDYGVL